jgi:hypothetical protein
MTCISLIELHKRRLNGATRQLEAAAWFGPHTIRIAAGPACMHTDWLALLSPYPNPIYEEKLRFGGRGNNLIFSSLIPFAGASWRESAGLKIYKWRNHRCPGHWRPSRDKQMLFIRRGVFIAKWIYAGARCHRLLVLFYVQAGVVDQCMQNRLRSLPNNWAICIYLAPMELVLVFKFGQTTDTMVIFEPGKTSIQIFSVFHR